MSTQKFETASPLGVKSVSKRLYEIADRVISIEIETGRVEDFVEEFLKGFRLEPLKLSSDIKADIRLRITDARQLHPLDGLERFPIPGGACSVNSEGYFLDVCGGQIEVGSFETGEVTIRLGDAFERNGRNHLITLLAYALPATLRRLSLYDLHAAGLVEPESGSGALFAGMSGSGKTSLSVRLTSAGWRYLSDDLLILSDGDSGVEARGLRRPFQSSASSLAGCELPRLQEALGVSIPNDPEKRKLDPEILFPDSFARVCLPKLLCFPTITGESVSRLKNLGKAEAMARLLNMCPWSSYDTSSARAHLNLLARLVEQCDTYALDAGRDVFDDSTGAARLLSRVLR